MTAVKNILEKKWSGKSAAILFVILFALGVGANELRFSEDVNYTFKANVWADRAGYYIYLPSALLHNMDGREFPDTSEILMGHGYKTLEGGKIYTKYPIGVAYFQLPFYCTALTINKIIGVPNTGVTRMEHMSVIWASVFWGIVALFLMYRLLLYYVSTKVASLTSVIILFGTNLLYYTVLEGGMSHVYSFLLFTALLFFLKKAKEEEAHSVRHAFGIAVCLGLIIAVRQLNIAFALPILLFFETGNLKEVVQRVRWYFKPKHLAVMILVPALILLPQVLYYYYVSGTPFLYSYEKEGFDNLFSPKIIEVLFAARNGLFPYSLVLLIAYSALVVMAFKGVQNSRLWLGVLFMVLFSYASWHSWELGCAMGHRGHTDVFIVFAFALSWVLTQVESWTARNRNIFYGLITLLVLFNVRQVFCHSFCYFGDGIWDWAYYWNRIEF